MWVHTCMHDVYSCTFILTHIYKHTFIYDESLRFGGDINFGEKYRNCYFEVVNSYNSENTGVRFWTGCNPFNSRKKILAKPLPAVMWEADYTDTNLLTLGKKKTE